MWPHSSVLSTPASITYSFLWTPKLSMALLSLIVLSSFPIRFLPGTFNPPLTPSSTVQSSPALLGGYSLSPWLPHHHHQRMHELLSSFRYEDAPFPKGIASMDLVWSQTCTDLAHILPLYRCLFHTPLPIFFPFTESESKLFGVRTCPMFYFL